VAKELGGDRHRKNIVIGDRRTSVSLEEQVWGGLIDICRREELSIDDLCTRVNAVRIDSSMSSSLRVFLLTYYRLVAQTAEAKAEGNTAPGLAQPPQAVFGRAFDIALAQFAEDQRRQATT
jgi:predicted DNA-binding ribbon-helix-helix protein